MSVVSSSGASAPEAVLNRPPRSSYIEILKSTAIVGGSQVLTIAIGIVRTKSMALLLGPSGFGLMGLLSSVADLTQAIAGLGIHSSGVRQIAASAGAGDRVALARVAVSLKRTAWVAGVLGALALAAGAETVSQITFGSPDQRPQLFAVALAVLFGVLTAGHAALLQGLRRIADLARMAVLGALVGSVLAVGLVAWLGPAGTGWALASVAAANFASAWWFGRKLDLPKPVLDVAGFVAEVRPLLGLGLAFMATSLLTMGSAYAIRILLVKRTGMEGAGLYQAAWTLGGLYVGLILQAMGADFYPRLTAAARDNARGNRLINEQAAIGFLLAGPGILATLIFAPLALRLFYSPQFAAAVDTLRWLCLGIAIRLAAWPLGFLLLAKGAKGMFFLSDAFWTVVNLALATLLTPTLGLPGVGISFVAAYVFQACLNYGFARHLSGFRWSSPTLRIAIAAVLAVTGGFLLTAWLPPAQAMLAGGLLLAAVTLAAARRLQDLLGVPLWRFSEIRRRLSAEHPDP